jgi:hypothetical protein
MQMKKVVHIIFKRIFISALSLVLPALIMATLTLDSAQKAVAQQAQQAKETE